MVGNYPWVTPTDISTRRDIYTSERCITASGRKRLRPLPANSVLVTCIASIGKNAILRTDGACNQQINAVIPNLDHSSEFLYYLFNSRKTYLLANAGITATNIISKSVFRNLLFPMPPTKIEQESIAAVLSDADDLIQGLEQLLAKKRGLKLGAMQQLLTGKKRLPGFSGTWETKRLGDLVSRLANGAVYKATTSSGLPVTRIETISEGAIDYTRTGHAAASPDLESYKMVPGDILFSHINSLDHIGKVALFLGPQDLYHGMNLLLMRANEYTESRFLYHWLTSNPARRMARRLARQAVSQASINTTELKALELSLPARLEQTAIATILSDMDAEIAALEQKLAKVRNLKQGMMQELLTGRIRLL